MEVLAASKAFASLNDEQRQAVEHGLDGDPREAVPLLVIAGAGSGKTKTLAARVARLIAAGADPHRVLLMTFSRRAAHEMAQRAGAMLHAALGLPATQRVPGLPWAGTFHGIGARLLREYAARVGLAEHFTVHDRGDSEDLIDVVRHEHGLSQTKGRARFPLKSTCLSIYSRVVNGRSELSRVLQEHFPWCLGWEDELGRLFAAYVEAKQKQQVLDYDDLLLYWYHMLDDAALAAEIGARFDHVLVDEYQDTNRLQAAILERMKPDGRGVVAVGDDAQAIYSFRCAEVRNILDFAQRFSMPAMQVTLERNYRSTQPILDASNAVIELASERFSKRLWTDRASTRRPTLVSVEDEAAQARWVADEVLAARESGFALRTQAVLFRTSAHSAALELELVRRHIPFVKFGGLRFLEAAHIKDVLSLLRWADNPRNELAGFRVAKLIAGIGPATARRLAQTLAAAPDPVRALGEFAPPPAASGDFAAFVQAWTQLHAQPRPWPADLERAVQWYTPLMRQTFDDAPVREADLAQLLRIAAGHASRERFLTELALDPPDATSDEAAAPSLDEDYLILSTIHSAKGQEWRAVYLLNAVDGCMPADLSTGSTAMVEEERRLLYVAMTRAKERLCVMVPQRFYVHQQSRFGDRHVYGSLTRFIPEQVARFFDHEGPSCDAAATASDAAPAMPGIDLGARIRAAWR